MLLPHNQRQRHEMRLRRQGIKSRERMIGKRGGRRHRRNPSSGQARRSASGSLRGRNAIGPLWKSAESGPHGMPGIGAHQPLKSPQTHMGARLRRVMHRVLQQPRSGPRTPRTKSMAQRMQSPLVGSPPRRKQQGTGAKETRTLRVQGKRGHVGTDRCRAQSGQTLSRSHTIHRTLVSTKGRHTLAIAAPTMTHAGLIELAEPPCCPRRLQCRPPQRLYSRTDKASMERWASL